MMARLTVLTDRWVIAAAATVAVVQILYTVLAHPIFNPDGYLNVGLNFNHYWHVAQDEITMRTPGYPLLVTLIYGAGLGKAGIVAIQICLVTAALVGLSGVAELASGPRTARLCAWLFVAYLPLWSHSSIARTEAVAIPLLIFAVLALQLRERSSHRHGWTAAAGALCGLAVIVRPNCVSFLLIVGVFLLLKTFRDERRAAAVTKAAVLFILPILVIFAPWVARNLSHEGRLDPLGHNPFPLPLGIHLPYETRIGEFASFRRSDTFFLGERSDGFNEVAARNSDSWEVLKDDLHSHMGEFVTTRFVAQFQMWPWPATPLVEKGENSVIPYPLIMVLHVLVLLAGLVGLVKLRREPAGVVGLAFVGGLVLVHVLYLSLPRYALPALPFLLVGSAVLFSQITTSPTRLPHVDKRAT
jgi:4-amino-4-deoxy-L-arabinose transferase-like glycosyltransferase